MARFHLSKNGEPRACTARPGNCPLGGEHFNSEEEARAHFESTQGNSFNIGSKMQTYNPTKEVQLALATKLSTRLRKGDVLEGSPITSVKIGTKWVTVSTEDNPKILLEKDSVATVMVEVSTPEAEEAAERKYRERAVAFYMTSAKEQVQKAYDELAERREKYGRADYSVLGAVIESEAKNEIVELIENRQKRDGVSALEAAESVAEYYRKGLSGHLFSTGINRSSNQLHNLMEDTKTEAVLSFLRDFGDLK